MTTRYQRYCATGDMSLETLADNLTSAKVLHLVSSSAKPRSESRTLFDTLNWAISKEGWTLEVIVIPEISPASVALKNTKGSAFSGVVTRSPFENSNKPFSLDVNSIVPEVLGDRIRAITENLAIIATASINARVLELSHVDELKRRDVSVELVQNDCSKETWIDVNIDSADTSLDTKIRDSLNQSLRHLWVTDCTLDYYDNPLRQLRRHRGDYNVKTRITPKHHEKLSVSLANFLTVSLENAKLAYSVTKLRIDDEALHDFRVILRTTRAILEPIILAFDEGILRDLLKMTKKIAQATNHARDIDVIVGHLLESKLSNEVIGLLNAEKEEAAKTLLDYLEEHFNALEHQWQAAVAFLISASHGAFRSYGAQSASITAINTADFVKQSISEQRILCVTQVRATAQVKNPRAVDLHNLRKNFKRLRYLHESFNLPLSSLEAKDTTYSKEFQNHLGIFQDAEVRLKYLLTLINRHAESSADLEPLIIEAKNTRKATKETAVVALKDLSDKPGWKLRKPVKRR